MRSLFFSARSRLFDGDPTKNISDIRKVALVITRGKLISPSEIDKELGIKPFVQNAPTLKALPAVPTHGAATTAGRMRSAAGLDARD